MDQFCFDIGKLVNGIGLFIDLIGIYILLTNEIKLRDIDNKKTIPITKEDEKYHQKLRESGKCVGVYYSQAAMEAEEKHPPKKAFKWSKLGMVLLIVGFAIQISSLMISYCV